ncbi:Major facilitator superfamily domain, general substrate transporter, partial [Metarhizium majus ARSEF 297]
MRPTIPVAYLLPFLCVTLFVTQLGLSLSDLPSLKLMQDIACKKHYGLVTEELLPEEKCRDAAVQRILNRINIGISVSVTIGSALVAFPLGILADRVGRVPVLGASLLSLFLSQGYGMLVCWRWEAMPLEAMWAMGVFFLLGGGQRMAEAIVFTMVADVAPRSQRASWFQWVVGAVLAAELAGPFLSARLIESSIWLPLYVSLALVAVGGVLLALLSPETLCRKTDCVKEDLDGGSPVTTKRTIMAIFSRPAVFLVPGAVLSLPMAATLSGILFRFMPVQFHWQLSKSALLVSLRSMITLVTLLLLLPGAAYICNKKTTYSHRCRDSVFLRASALCFLAGSAFLVLVLNQGFIIAGVVLSALGSGIPTLCRSMMVSALGEKSTGLLFGILAIGEIIGFLCCTVAMGALFDVALTSWIGYPFVLGVVLAGAIFITSWMAGTSKEKATPEKADVVLEPLKN